MRVLERRVAVPARVVLGALGVGAAAGALAIAQGPGRFTTYAGSSTAGAVLTAGAGLALVAAALVSTLDRAPGRTADLAVVAGLTWFAPVWIAWQEGPPLVRSVATAAAVFTFPVVVHLVLAYPERGLVSIPTRLVVGTAYAEAIVTAVALALFRQPYLDRGCWANCAVNSFLVTPLPSFTHVIETGDRWFVAAAAVALAAISVIRLVRASRIARRRRVAIAVPAIAFAAAVIARAVELQRSTIENPFNTALFAIFAAAAASVMLLAAGLVLDVARRQSERRAVARVVVSLDEAPPPGSLQAALAQALGDPELRIAYRLSLDGRYVDANGAAVVDPAARPGHALARLIKNEETIAVVSHAGVVSDFESQIGPSVLLGLENERLQAEVLARLEELRASRARIVEAADLERQRLERDLHDGAQQRLLALSYDVRRARASAQAGGDATAEHTLSRAVEETQAALEELRELAHGIYPAVLAEAGLAPALSTLADTATLPVDVVGAGADRYPPAVETAAYFAIAEAVDDAARRGAGHAAVSVDQHDGRLVVTIKDDGTERSSAMTELADRVGALGGSLAVEPRALRAEIPCA